MTTASEMCVRVKPLEFDWAGEQCTVRYAASRAFWVGYRIGLRLDGRKALHVERIGGEDRLGDFASWDEAEAAANADYEQRVLSTLEPRDHFADAGEMVWHDACATDGCGRPATQRFEYGGVGTDYCDECFAKVKALAPAEGAAAPVVWRVSCSNLPDEWFTDSGAADQWANSPGHFDARVTLLYPALAAPAAERELTAAARDVLAERKRQVEAEGWTPEHDDQHTLGEMAMAAAAYALPQKPAGFIGQIWPWGRQWWKPSRDPRRNLVKAGALILAEIERLDRAARAAEAGKWAR